MTQKLNEYILTIQDNFTKYSLVIPLPNFLASAIADALLKKFICNFGSPRAILTDKGINFLSNLIRTLAKIFTIRQLKTTVFHPESNGSLERSHVLAEYLKQFVSKNSEYDDWMELATFSYDTSIYKGSRELVSDKLDKQPSSEPLPEHEKLETYDDDLIKLITRLQEIRAIAGDNLITAKERLKKYYDINISPRNFNVDEELFL